MLSDPRIFKNASEKTTSTLVVMHYQLNVAYLSEKVWHVFPMLKSTIIVVLCVILFHLVVFYCGDTENLIEDADEYIQNLLEHFSVVRPICINCRRQGKETKTWGKRLFLKKTREHKWLWLFKCQFKMCVLIKGTETTCIFFLNLRSYLLDFVIHAL